MLILQKILKYMNKHSIDNKKKKEIFNITLIWMDLVYNLITANRYKQIVMIYFHKCI